MGYVQEMAEEGDGSLELGNGQRASMQLFQQIYRDVTGKSEKISKFYDVNFCAVWGDFESLHQRIEHMLEQYNVVEKSCAVRISYTDDSHERFSSFDRSRVYDAGSMNIVESVTIEFNFLIVLPVAKKPQPYKITASLSSREGLREKARRHSGFEADLLSFMFSTRTAMVAIEYVDYAVARTLQREIDKWFEGLHSSKPSKVLAFAKRNNHHLPWVLKYATAVVCAQILLHSNVRVGDIQRLFFVGTISFVSIFALSGVAGRMGAVCERVIDGAQPLSYIELTRGDKQLLAHHRTSKIALIVKLLMSLLVAVGTNVAAAAIGHWLGLPS